MPKVTFQPSGNTVDVPVGMSLLDAATKAGVELTAPCGGTGSCGHCRVRVVSGEVRSMKRSGLSPEEAAQGWVLACATRVSGDVIIEGGWKPEEGARIVVADGPAYGTHGRAAEPIVVKRLLEVEPPSLDNSFDDLTRVEQALWSDGRRPRLTASLDTLRALAATLRADNHRVTATLLETDGGYELLRIEPGDTTGRTYGLAIDVGTTTCAIHLIDLAHNEILATGSDYNGQIPRGLDIISRINYARTPERIEELRGLVIETLNGVIGGLCGQQNISIDDLDSAAVAGNTTMIHLLLGLNPEYIRLDPYTPTVNRPPVVRAEELGLWMSPAGRVMFAPGVGSYVGGDITSGLLISALATDDQAVRLFLDIGTNGEVVIGNNEWLMACAASAGPAFEGSGVRCGMRAARGAIERVQINDNGQARIATVGDAPPRGICGSGMIDLLSELWRAGLLDPSGKLVPSRSPFVRECPDSTRCLEYVVAPADDSDVGKDIVLDERDIMNLLRTKAAVYSACAVMLRQVGLDFDAVEQVYVAGGFGRFLDIEKSIRIGLLPDLPLDRYTYLGNSSLAGARALLTSADARRKVVELADRITYLELNVDPTYMDEYTAALFLPHTDMKRFPSVRTT